jgi:hypothetical protein
LFFLNTFYFSRIISCLNGAFFFGLITISIIDGTFLFLGTIFFLGIFLLVSKEFIIFIFKHLFLMLIIFYIFIYGHTNSPLLPSFDLLGELVCE